MIRIAAVPPAPNYEFSVRHPGSQFLALSPSPSSAQFRQHNYWSRIHQYLYDSYSGICSYCASWIPRATHLASDHHSSVDHFLPKSHYPELAYQWTNFRISRKDINENKGDDCEIVDQFYIENGWFELDFLSCRIKASPQAHPILRQRIQHTIQILQLNEVPLIDERTQVIGNYAHDRMPFADLDRFYPFIAREVARQNFDVTLKMDVRGVHP